MLLGLFYCSKSLRKRSLQQHPKRILTMTIDPSAPPESRPGRRASPSLNPKLAKRKGELAELVFVLKAISLGFPVSKPFGDSEPYDLIVEDRGRLIRIQVKSAYTSTRHGYSIGTLHNGQTAQYVPGEVDFIAGYVAPHQAWYIIPIDQIAGHAHIRLYPRGPTRKGGANFEQYRDAWHLLRDHDGEP